MPSDFGLSTEKKYPRHACSDSPLAFVGMQLRATPKSLFSLDVKHALQCVAQLSALFLDEISRPMPRFPPLPTLVLQENEAWEGGVYARVAVPQSDSDETGSSGVNVTLAVALSVCLVAAVVVVGVAAKYIQRKVRAFLSLLRPLPVPPLLLLLFHPPARPEL